MINRVPLERIHQAAQELFAAAARDGRLMAIAVVDEAAALVYAERMEECDQRILLHAMRKAHTSAVMKRSTLYFRDQNAELGKTLADWGGGELTQLPGGDAIRIGGEWYGGVGVGGNTPERDVELVEAARKSLAGE